MTINEFRVALGREPLARTAADKAMALPASGYVPLGQEAAVQKRSVCTAVVPKADRLNGGISSATKDQKSDTISLIETTTSQYKRDLRFYKLRKMCFKASVPWE